jgi:malate synthase
MLQSQPQQTMDAVTLLDDLIPLQDASHTDVLEYSVDVPFRKAECHALLQDGRKVGLTEPWKFVGWSSHEPSRSLLFRVNGSHLELDVEDELAGKAPGKIHNVILEAVALRSASTVKKFIGVNGNQVLLPSCRSFP